MAKLSIIIVNYNVRHFLEQALHSVYKSAANLEVEIFVVDNNSVDNSCEMVTEKFPDVKLIANKENVGFAKANNMAINQSSAEYVLLLNPDTVLQEDTLSRCCEFMDQHLDCGGLGVRMIDGKGVFLPESKRGLPTPMVALYKMTGLSKIFPKSKIFGKYHLGYLKETEIHEVDVLSGAFMFLRKTALDKIGLLDEVFFMYGEDIDLSYRLTLGGYKNYYFPETTIIHFKGESTKKKSANYVKVFYNAMVLFARKHYSSKMAGWFAFFIALAIKLRAGIAFLFRFFESFFLPVVDFIGIYLGYFGIIKYWEKYNKFVHGFYPETYYTVHIPLYILVSIISVYFSGGYDKPLVLRRLVRGSLFGVIVLFSAYAFLPKEWQFSRAILGLGCAWTVAAPICIRYLKQLFLGGKLNLTGIQNYRIAIVANEAEAKRIKLLLSESSVMNEFVGFISPNEEKPNGYVGTTLQLDEVIAIFNINLIIFSAADVPGANIMAIMSKYSAESVNFKIVPANSLAIIGSNNKNIPGELFTIDLRFTIAELSSRRIKRIFDIGLAVLLVLILPISLLKKNGRKLIIEIPGILVGKRTWVSYSGRPGTEGLPAISNGPVAPVISFKDSTLEPNINLAYARDYNIQKDITAVWRYLFS